MKFKINIKKSGKRAFKIQEHTLSYRKVQPSFACGKTYLDFFRFPRLPEGWAGLW